MNLFSRRQSEVLRFYDAIDQFAKAQRVKPITFADRFAAVCDALDNADEVEVAGTIRALLSLIKTRDVRLDVLAAVQEDTWGDV
jgi:hypothetical protein